MPSGTPTPRPPYWSPEYVLAEMSEGRTYSEIARAAAGDVGLTGDGFKPDTWWYEVHRWKTERPGFAEQYAVAIQECYRVRGEKLPESSDRAGRPEEFGPELQLAFLQEMMANGGNAVQACYDVGISKGTVFSRLNPKSPKFDQAFAEHFYVAEAERGGQLYEAVWEEGMEKLDEYGRRNPILLRHLSETRLPHLFSSRKTLEIEGHISHQHEVLPAAVTRQIARTNQALLPEPREAIEAEVTEAEYVEVEP